MVKERIQREQDPEKINRMMNEHACRLDSVADAWHVLCVSRSMTSWRDRKVVKNQFDLARYFYLIHDMRPEIILETGLQGGGSVLFFLDTLEMLNMAHVPYIGIDLDASWALDAVKRFHPEKPVLLVSNDCLADATLREIVPCVQGKRALVILDSVHSEEHVTEELRLYAPLCGVESCLVVEDTDHNRNPVFSDYGPSAWEAVRVFLKSGEGLGWAVDKETECMFGPFTNSPGGWLRKK